MNQKKNNNLINDEITIDLAELFRVFLDKIIIILIVGIACGIIAYVGTKMLIVPEYDSTTKIYIMSRSNADVVTSSDLAVSSYLTKDYAELVVSRPVLENVIQVLNLDMTTKALKESVTVTTPTDTRILSITVANPDPQMAKKIADAIRETAAIQIQAIMDVEAVNTVEDGNLPVNPARPSNSKNAAIGAIIGILITMIIIAIAHISDDTIKTSEDIEKYLGLNTLASISEKDGSKKKQKKSGKASSAKASPKKKKK